MKVIISTSDIIEKDEALAFYAGFHQQLLTAKGGAVAFYEQMGFERAGKTVPMWIYGGDEH